MGRVLSREDAKKAVNLLREKQPRTFEDFKQALGMRVFELKKLLKNLETEKVIIRESLSGVEKFWLNESQVVNFWGRNPQQKKRLRHPHGKKLSEDSEEDNPIYG